jgi:hypothetical protein
MPYTLTERPGSNDFDIVDTDDPGKRIGQVVASKNGYTIYLHGDLEALLPPYPSSDAALEAFEDWTASNTLTVLPIEVDEPPLADKMGG